MRIVAGFLAACICFGSAASPTAAEATSSKRPIQEQRLIAFARMWGAVRFFDPTLAYRTDVDWNQVLADSYAQVAAATTDAQYKAAISQMLSALHEPATEVVEPGLSIQGIDVKQTSRADGTLVLTMSPSKAADYQSEIDSFRAAATAASKAKGLVVDLRGIRAASDVDGNLDTAITQSRFVSSVIAETIPQLASRHRTYLGFPPEVGDTSGGYSANFEVNAGSQIFGKAQRDVPVVIVVNKDSAVPGDFLAMIAAGKAQVVADGDAPPIAGSASAMPMPGGFSVSLTEYELLGLKTLPVVARASGDAAVEAAERTALDFHAVAAAAFNPPNVINAPASYQGSVEFPDLGDRILAVFKAYNIIRYFYPYRDLMHDDWDQALLDGVRGVTAATTAREYDLALLAMYSHLHDLHGFVAGGVLSSDFGSNPPFAARMLHGEAVITSLIDKAVAEKDGFQVGDVLLSIDGVPMQQLYNLHRVYVNAATPQAVDRLLLGAYGPGSVFTGAPGSKMTVRIQTPAGKRATITTTRSSYVLKNYGHTGPVVTILPGNIGYADLARLEVPGVDSMFQKFKDTRAIIFDDRGYPHGTVWSIASRLSNEPGINVALFDTPMATSMLPGNDEARMLPVFRDFYQKLPASSAPKYAHPTDMLIDERAVSQAEHTGLFLEAANGTRFVGTPTDGSNGDVTNFSVPGGLVMYFTGQGVRHADGRQLQRVGLMPNVRVEPTARDISRGDDVVLQAAMRDVLVRTGADPKEVATAIVAEQMRERAQFIADQKPEPASPAPVGDWFANAVAGDTTLKYSGVAAPTEHGAASPMRTIVSSASGRENMGSYARIVNPAPFLGKRVKFSGFLKTSNVSFGGAWMRVDGADGKVLAFDNMHDRWLRGTQAWTPFSIVLDVPTDARGIMLGLLIGGGPGSLSGDALTIDVVGDDVPVTNSP